MATSKRRITDEVADAAFRAVQFTPLEPYSGSGVPRLCRCGICGNECRVSYSSVRLGKRGCKRCWTDLIAAKTRKSQEIVDAVFEAAKMTPLEPYVSANKARRALCQVCGTEGRTTYATLSSGHGGCKPCGYEVVSRKLQALKTNIEAIDSTYAKADLTVLEPWINASVPRLARCNKCGNEAKISYGSLHRGQGGCRPCGSAKRGLSQRNPAEVVALAFDEANLEPLEDYQGTDVRRKCRCLECGKTVFTSYKDIAGSRKMSGCRYCAYRKMGERKVLPSQLVDALFTAKDLEPLEEYGGASVPRLCRCMKCGRKVSPLYNSLKSGQGGCKYCSPVGLQRAAPGILYLLKNASYCALKVGVTSETARKNRIKSHCDNGWEIVKTWKVVDAGLAETVETAVLSHWRITVGAPIAMQQKDMPQGGYSETVAMLFIDEHDATQMIEIALAQVLNR